MATPGSVIGWRLDRDQRADLLERFPPRYANAIADHVTLDSEAGGKPLPEPVEAEILGHVDDGRGVEAMVVAVGGTTDRPDGSTFHITWSLGPGRAARESNDALKGGGWRRFDQSVPVAIRPARF